MQMLESEEILQRAQPALESFGKESGEKLNEVLIKSKQANEDNCPKFDWKISCLKESYGFLIYLKNEPNSMKSFGFQDLKDDGSQIHSQANSIFSLSSCSAAESPLFPNELLASSSEGSNQHALSHCI